MKVTEETQLVDQHTMTQLRGIAGKLRQHREELVEQWTNSYRSSPMVSPDLREELAIAEMRRLIELFITQPQRVRTNGFVEQAKVVGRTFAEQGLQYDQLTLATSLFEKVSLPFITREYTQPEAQDEAVAAFHRFTLSLLALFDASYSGALEESLLRRHEGEQAEINRRREALITMVVHDIRGPLTSILGFSQLIERALASGKSCDPRQVGIIARETKRLQGIVDELADMSLIEAGRLELERQPTDMVEIARSVIDEIQPAALSHHIDLKATNGAVVGNWDPKRLRQTFKHLIDYAMKFSPEGGDVTVQIRPNKDKVTVTVLDQGLGMPKELIPLVFEPFSRFFRERRIKGMGVGLFVARGIVESLGGHVWVESELGKGNKLTFVLPLKA